MSAHAASIQYDQTDLFTGLGPASASRVDSLLDNFLSSSSMKTVNSALTHWDVVRERCTWPRVMVTGDKTRGAKLVEFVLYLMDDTSLVYSSISNYVWGLRWRPVGRTPGRRSGAPATVA